MYVHESAARPLREEWDRNHETNTAKHSFGSEQVFPASLLLDNLILDSSLDLFEFVDYQRVVLITAAMIVDEGIEGFFLTDILNRHKVGTL